MTPSIIPPETARFSDLLRQVTAAGWQWQSADLDQYGFTWTLTEERRPRWANTTQRTFRITDDTGAGGLRTFLAIREREQAARSRVHHVLQAIGFR